jgi:serine/threonine protein kinase
LLTGAHAAILPAVRNEFPQTFGPYELLRRLGRGGMAEVFLAKASSKRGEGRLIALKRMHFQLYEDQSAVDMLVQEARLCMRFSHDNIAQTFELGNHDGTYFFIMEYVDGIDLGALANLVESRNGRLDSRAVAHICLGMARGLSYAHELVDENGQRLGIVHRDVSPQNVLISRTGGVKLIDFGVAKVASRIQQTMAGIIKGKYAYMSPEQASADGIDARSDVFSLGICMWELFSGRPLFRALGSASPFAILRAVRDDPIAYVHNLAPGLPMDLSRIVHQALERDVRKRFQSMAAAADELEAWLKRSAPGYGPEQLAAYVRQVVAESPQGALPQSSIATPPIAKMRGDEYVPSQLSVVAASPLDLQRNAANRPSSRPSGARVPSLNVPRTQLPPNQRGPLEQMPPVPGLPPPLTPAQAQQLALLRQRSWYRPSRRTVVQFLWVGVVALVFVVGWSTIATLARMGKL